jgi:hypothetical protein
MLPQVLLALALTATPYVRARTSSSDAGAHCLHWDEPQVAWVQNAVSSPPSSPASFDAVSRGFSTWKRALATCGGLTLTEEARSSSRKAGPTAGATPKENLVLFRFQSCAVKAPPTAACWLDGSCANAYDCWDHATGLLGVTLLSYYTGTGQIIDADIELNAAENTFTTVSGPVCTTAVSLSCVATDVQNTVTHEVGHFLGLAHAADRLSTMSATSMLGDLAKRQLDTASAQFVCDAYPKGLPAQDCAPPTTGCGAAPAGLSGLVALVACLLATRRRPGRRAPRHAGLAGALLALLLLPATARATTMVLLDLDTLTQVSDAVVRGTVVRAQARWTVDHARIVTEVELEVAAAWKGAPGRRVVLLQPGGEVDGVGQLVEGVARFVPGEEVVAFLEARGPVFTVAGYAQGRFAVERTATRVAASQPSGMRAALLDPFTRQEVAWAPLSLPLAELEARVRARVQAR